MGDWSLADSQIQKTLHLGQPDRFDFDWVVMTADMEASVPTWWNRDKQSLLQMGRVAASILLISSILIVGWTLKLCTRCRNVSDEEDNHYHAVKDGKCQTAGMCPTGANSLYSPGAGSSGYDPSSL